MSAVLCVTAAAVASDTACYCDIAAVYGEVACNTMSAFSAACAKIRCAIATFAAVFAKHGNRPSIDCYIAIYAVTAISAHFIVIIIIIYTIRTSTAGYDDFAAIDDNISFDAVSFGLTAALFIRTYMLPSNSGGLRLICHREVFLPRMKFPVFTKM